MGRGGGGESDEIFFDSVTNLASAGGKRYDDIPSFRIEVRGFMRPCRP